MSRALRPGKCGRCKALVVSGDCLRTHVASRADVGILSTPGLALAVLTRRWTFHLIRVHGIWSIAVRDPDEILARLAAPVGAPALADHVCHVPLPTEPGPTALDLIAPPDMSEDALAHELGLPTDAVPPF